jgi:hypothetical protein
LTKMLPPWKGFLVTSATLIPTSPRQYCVPSSHSAFFKTLPDFRNFIYLYI